MKISAFVLAVLLSVSGFGWDNLDYGIPAGGGTNELLIIDREGYAVGYDTVHRQPRWVSYRLTAEEALQRHGMKRTNDFREDERVPTEFRSTLEDFRGSGYDRGHLAPAADMAWSTNAMSESFYLSNMSPQAPDFNRGIWKELESWVRDVAERETNLVVISGCIFKGCRGSIGENKVAVPWGYYKVLYDETEPKKMIGFLLPNCGSNKPIKDYACSVRMVEAISGLDFFSLLDVDEQEKLEYQNRFDEWEGNMNY